MRFEGIYRDKRSDYKAYIVVSEPNIKPWLYVESLLPEENCADWAQKFWAACYESLVTHRKRLK